MPHTSQGPEPDGYEAAAFDDDRRRHFEPGLAGFEDELRRRLATEPNGSMGSGEWRKALDEWIAVHPYVQRRARCEACRSCPRDARTAEEVAAETTGRLWQDLSRAERPALGWDGRDSGFWPQVIRQQTMKTLRQNDPYWNRFREKGGILSESIQEALQNMPGKAADLGSRLLSEELAEQVDVAMMTLPSTIRRDSQQAFELVLLKQYSQREAAALMGLKRDRVAYLVKVAMKKLRVTLRRG